MASSTPDQDSVSLPPLERLPHHQKEHQLAWQGSSLCATSSSCSSMTCRNTCCDKQLAYCPQSTDPPSHMTLPVLRCLAGGRQIINATPDDVLMMIPTVTQRISPITGHMSIPHTVIPHTMIPQTMIPHTIPCCHGVVRCRTATLEKYVHHLLAYLEKNNFQVQLCTSSCSAGSVGKGPAEGSSCRRWAV